MFSEHGQACHQRCQGVSQPTSVGLMASSIPLGFCLVLSRGERCVVALYLLLHYTWQFFLSRCWYRCEWEVTLANQHMNEFYLYLYGNSSTRLIYCSLHKNPPIESSFLIKDILSKSKGHTNLSLSPSQQVISSQGFKWKVSRSFASLVNIV